MNILTSSWEKKAIFFCHGNHIFIIENNSVGRLKARQKSSQSKGRVRALILQPAEIAEEPGEEREDRKG